MRDVTINQGVGSYSPLEYGKETLVRLYLSMPSCAASGASIQITNATLTVSGGAATTVRMAPTPSPTAYPAIATYSTAPAVDSTGDPKFVIPGSALAPTGGAAFNVSFSATVDYQAKSSKSATPVSGSAPFSNLPTASFDGKTNPFHVLVVPMGDASKVYSSQFSATAQAAVQDGMTGTVARVFPLAAGVGNLGSTAGEGLQYTIAPTLLPLNLLRDSSGTALLDSTGKFCGTGASYDAIKGQLFQMLRSWQTANANAQVDSVLGVIDPAIAKGPPDPCFEGMGSLGSAEAWAQAITGRGGQLAALELAHTLGLTPKDRESPFDAGHSQNITAENPQVNRRFNVVQRAFITTDRSLMKPSASSPAPDNNNTLFEAPDFGYARSVFGGTATSEYTQFPKTLGTITAASLVFVMSGTTNGTTAGTHIVESYFSANQPSTAEDATSDYKLRQMPGNIVTGVPVSFTDSQHGGSATAQPAPSALFSIAQIANPNTTRIEFWKGTPGAQGSVLLYSRDQSTPPVITGMTAGTPTPLGLRRTDGGAAAPPAGPLKARHVRHKTRRKPKTARPARQRTLAATNRALAGTTYTVTSTLDGTGCAPGDCTLRGAIAAANANPGADTIAFAIGAPGSSQSIQLGSTSLPQINDDLTIDGWSQGGVGYTGPPLIEVNGASAPSDGLMANKPVTIQGLVVNRFAGSAVDLYPGSSGSLVRGNYIGTNASGTAAAANGGTGVYVASGSTGNTIGGSGSARNVISANSGGVVLVGGSNMVTGNYLGTNAAGTAALGNTDSGVLVESNSNTVTNNVASGATTTSGFGAGIALDGGGGGPITDNLIQGNYVGTDASGNARLGNSRRGIQVFRASRTTITGNVVSGNSGPGIFIAASAPQNVVKGNLIGVGADGATPLGQSFGIEISGESLETIGGVNPGDGNVIANSDSFGIVITGAATGNNILGNRIYGNGSVGIKLGNDPNPTPNDAGDSDTGPNNLQNYPVLSSASLSGGNLTLTGTLDTNAGLSNNHFRLEAFLNTSCDPSGNGEGETFVGGTDITVDATGHGAFNVSFPTAATGSVATVTATAAGTGDTSEFSACMSTSTGGGGGDETQVGPTFTVNQADDHDDGVCSVADCTLREAIKAANTHPNGTDPDKIEFGISGSAPHTISATSALPSVTGRVTIDGGDANIVDGSSAGASTKGLVFAAGSGDSTVANLQIQGFGSYAIDLQSSGNTIGGDSTSGNVLLGYGGVLVEHGADENVIAGNTLGLTPAGALNVGGGSGVRVDEAAATVIGDDKAPPDHANNLFGNVIVGYQNGGVYLNGAVSTKLDGNFIGTNRSGSTGLGNNVGVYATGGAGNYIGPDNEITRNSSYGVDVETAGNRVVANSIHDNGSLGIHSAPAVGVSAPSLTAAELSGSSTTITGTYSGGPANTTLFFEIFKNSQCDPSGSGEGQTYIDFAQATTDGSGNATFTKSLTGFAIGDVVTATATNGSAFSTSQFSNCRIVTSGGGGAPPGPGQEPVAVTATDDHPADLRLDLFLDCGSGKPKLPVAVGLKPDASSTTAASFSYNYDPSLACPNGTLQAVANDGFTTTGFTTAGSTPVNPGPDTPRVAITSPPPGKTFLTYSLIPLRGSARDSSGELPDSGLQWSISGPSGITRNGTGHQVDFDPPSNGGWPSGTYNVTFTGTRGTKSASTTTTFTVKTDADNDGMPADVEAQSCFTSGDNDPLNAYADYDGDGIPNASDPQACTAATSYSAIADFNPDPLAMNDSSGVVTMTVKVPFRNVAQVLSSSVRLTKIAEADVSADPRFQSISWTVSGGVGTAKFDRAKLIQYLAGRDIHNRTITITIGGRSGAPPWSFEGSDTVFVQG